MCFALGDDDAPWRPEVKCKAPELPFSDCHSVDVAFSARCCHNDAAVDGSASMATMRGGGCCIVINSTVVKGALC